MKKSIFILSLCFIFACSTAKHTASKATTGEKTAATTSSSTSTTTSTTPPSTTTTTTSTTSTSTTSTTTTAANPNPLMPVTAMLSQGKAVYEGKCTGCHGLKDPKNYTEVELSQIVPDMVAKTNRKAGSEVISSEKQQMLMTYLVANCKK